MSEFAPHVAGAVPDAPATERTDRACDVPRRLPQRDQPARATSPATAAVLAHTPSSRIRRSGLADTTATAASRREHPLDPAGSADEQRVRRSVGAGHEHGAPTGVPRIRPAARTESEPTIIRRANAFYSGQPRSEDKENPLHTIKTHLEQDGVAGDRIAQHWQNDDNLHIAATAKKSLTHPEMDTIKRPIESSAWLDTPNRAKGSRKDPAWISAIGNLGTVEDQVLGETPQKYNGGHLIAWEFLNDAANVKGNIAPQADTQNQALFRRIERTLMETITSGTAGGVELTVYTPYNRDNYRVSYRELFERNVLTDASIRATLDEQGLLDKELTFAQMAPDTYNTYFLTQTSSAAPSPADKREQRLDIKTQQLSDYSNDTSDALIGQAGLGNLAILASNYDDQQHDQVATAFAHIVYINHRAHPPSPASPKGTLADLPSARAEVLGEASATTPTELPEPDERTEPGPQLDDRGQREIRALDWMEAHLDLCVDVQVELEREFGYSANQAFDAILGALMID